MKSLAIALFAALATSPLCAQEITRIPVYFPVADSTLTREAIAAVDEAAAEIKARGLTTRIVIAGSEQPEPEGASLITARARAIEAELIARGVAPGSIRLFTTSGLTAAIGSPPMSSLADRRAEIVLE